ncbi:uncharacterized protein [Cicer arietinum]|uniref:uncharacterized protein n=1 Tax=Cicer arietinum TaxID=3827 RepID=UPI003CC6D53C
MINEYNPLVKIFRQVRDHVEQGGSTNFYIRLFGNHLKHARIHNLPTCDEVAVLIIGDNGSIEKGGDVIVKNFLGEYERLYKTFVSFLSLKYPLLFPYGEDGFHAKIKVRLEYHKNIERKWKRVAMKEFISYSIQDRSIEYGNIVHSRRLFQQFVIDCYTMLETHHLTYIRTSQQIIRCDILNGLQEAVTNSETDASDIGRKSVQ